LNFSVAASDGPLLFGPPPLASQAVEQMVQLPSLPLRLTVWPKDPEALLRRGAARQNFYLGMVGGIAALLAFGSYLAVRTVRAELAVARMKAGFVSTVSHEFRSPLAGINQLAEMLRDGRVEDGERRQHYYEMIVSETQRLRRLVENILDFSRMEEKRKQYRFEPFDTGAWLEGLAGGFRKELAAPRCELSVSIPADLPPLAGDREALTTAVHNLLDNAAKYSNGSTGIRLEARTEGADLLISVYDRGAGIADKDKPHVFEKFYRGAATAREVKGAGLGLSLVRHIVLAHGGQVTFDSRQGEGSTFTIRLAAGR
jgi:signal transduction histidine kinase